MCSGKSCWFLSDSCCTAIVAKLIDFACRRRKVKRYVLCFQIRTREARERGIRVAEQKALDWPLKSMVGKACTFKLSLKRNCGYSGLQGHQPHLATTRIHQNVRHAGLAGMPL